MNWLWLHIPLFLVCVMSYASSVSTMASSTTAAKDCIKEGSMSKFMECFDKFIKLPDTVTAEDWAAIRPTRQELMEWRRLSGEMLDAQNDADCREVKISPILQDQVLLQPVEFCGKEKVHCKKYCLLYETKLSINGKFHRGLGMFAVDLSPKGPGNLHISAAHPITDNNVHFQTAYVADNTPGIKSVTITGATRWAYRAEGDCQKKYSPMDAAHNVDLMFHQSLLATMNWQKNTEEGRSCLPGKCQFIQFHGMRNTTCTDDDLFVSAGFGNKIFYTNSLPAYRIAKAVGKQNPKWKVTTVIDSKCILLATTNTFGRVLNGISPDGSECTKIAEIDRSDKLFTHVESHYWALAKNEYHYWPPALIEAFSLSNGAFGTSTNFGSILFGILIVMLSFL